MNEIPSSAPMLFSIIIPSRGTRPKALAQAIDSALEALNHAGSNLAHADVEIQVGFHDYLPYL